MSVNHSPQLRDSVLRAWVVSTDMGYGHLRAVHPFREIAEDGIINMGESRVSSERERRQLLRVQRAYEMFSRARGVPVFGKPLFFLLDSMLRIPSFYPIRNLSQPTFQVDLLASTIKKGLGSGVLGRLRKKQLPLLTSFYAPAIAADMAGLDRIFCIICDADLNRVWVAREPSESRIHYFAPCGKAAQRLMAYGVPQERITTTGFPLPPELLGEDLAILKHDLGRRLRRLDPASRFWPLHRQSVEHFLGTENCEMPRDTALTITYAVGGAGAQMEIGGAIARSLTGMLRDGSVRLNLVAGIRKPVQEYFLEVQKSVGVPSNSLRVQYAESLDEYFATSNALMHETDILWTKPSELSFFCGLGIPIIMTPTIGSQEKFNRAWLMELGAGIRQHDPAYAHQWLFDYLRKGRLADAAWAGFLKARKRGTYAIIDYLKTGAFTYNTSPLHR